MIADVDRFSAYAAAIAQAVRPGDVVADIGCGPGMFALLACRAGARRVFAIDPDPVIDVGRQLAQANGFQDRIEFIQQDSRRINLPEPANVIISDLRGVLPLFENLVPSLADARKRFLAPGGVLIPRCDDLKVAVVETRSFYRSLVEPWQQAGPGLDLSPAAPLILNDVHKTRLQADELLTDPQLLHSLDYRASIGTGIAADFIFSAKRHGIAHGVCIWFETQLFGNIGFSCAPGCSPASVYGQLFLPWLSPFPVSEGEHIDVRLNADLVSGEYVWRWQAKCPVGYGEPRICIQQSTFQSARFSAQSLRRRATDFVPTLSEAGRADTWLLQAMNGRASLQEIAELAAKRFPQLFVRTDDAFRRAVELAERLSE